MIIISNFKWKLDKNFIYLNMIKIVENYSFIASI